jgi:hypothetical protein
MTTALAPSGIEAPVVILATVPLVTVKFGTFPALTLPTTGNSPIPSCELTA